MIILQHNQKILLCLLFKTCGTKVSKKGSVSKVSHQLEVKKYFFPKHLAFIFFLNSEQ